MGREEHGFFYCHGAHQVTVISMSNFNFTIRPDGFIDLDVNGILLSDIVPYIDEQAILPTDVETGNDSITYMLDDGSITVRIKVQENELVLSAEADLTSKVHDIEPVGMAVLSNADHVYITGLGMEGPSGYFEINKLDRRSYGIVGLSGEGKAISVFAVDNRQFNTQFSVRNCEQLYSSKDVFTCGVNLEGTRTGKIVLPDINFIADADVVSCMSRAASAIAAEMKARTSAAPAFHWCSWYYYYENMNQEILDGLLSDLRNDPVDFRYVQVDAGYVDHTGDWLRINDRYPDGLGKAAKSIIDSGYKAGIWMAPFMVGDCSETYREHPDWIIRNKDNSPYVVFRSYTEPKIWGNTDNDYYVLDTTNPEAFRYLEEVFTRLKEYGYSLYKVDFLLWCMVDTSEVKRYDSGKTSVEVYRDVMEMIRRVVGDDSYIIASIAPYMASVGYADGVRIAGDMGASWEGAYGPENLLKELPYDNYFNNVFWQNDPDSVILRNFGTHLTDKETRSLALLQALSGGIITTSDPVDSLPEDRRKLLEFIKPGDDRVHADLPFLTNGDEEMVITHKLNDWNLLFVLNPTDHPVKVLCKLDEIFGAEALFQYRFNFDDGELIESEKISYFSDSIAPHDSVLLFITEEPLHEKPSNLWCRRKGFISNHN